MPSADDRSAGVGGLGESLYLPVASLYLPVASLNLPVASRQLGTFFVIQVKRLPASPLPIQTGWDSW